MENRPRWSRADVLLVGAGVAAGKRVIMLEAAPVSLAYAVGSRVALADGAMTHPHCRTAVCAAGAPRAIALARRELESRPDAARLAA